MFKYDFLSNFLILYYKAYKERILGHWAGCNLAYVGQLQLQTLQ